MPGTSFDSDADFDPQDQAETLDESMTVGGEGDVALGGDSPLSIGEDMRTFEELPDVLDVTQVAGDRDDDEALALDADEFDEDVFDDDDLEDDDELDYGAVTADREDELDGLGGEDDYDDDVIEDPDNIEGLEVVADGDSVSGGEDDFTNFQSKAVDDEELRRMGYTDEHGKATGRQRQGQPNDDYERQRNLRSDRE